MHAEIIEKIQKLVGGKNMPIFVMTAPGGKVSVSYESEWKEGGTKAVEKTTGKGKNAKTTIEYQEDYKTVKLTAAEVKKVDEYIAELG